MHHLVLDLKTLFNCIYVSNIVDIRKDNGIALTEEISGLYDVQFCATEDDAVGFRVICIKDVSWALWIKCALRVGHIVMLDEAVFHDFRL